MSGSDSRRRIVFVADDLGVSQGVNRGIERVARAGLVREASLCVTGAAVVEGVAVAREAGLGLGLHLSFTLGQALTGPIRGLTDAAGSFHGLRRVLLACCRDRVDRRGAAREIAAQIDRAFEFGLEVTHFNGHHHVHCFPILREIAFAAAAQAGIGWTRLPAEVVAVAGRRLRPADLLLRSLSFQSRPLLRACGLRAAPFVGLAVQGRRDYYRRFAALLGRLPPGDCEWMVHPRVSDAAFSRLDLRARGSECAAEAELAGLLRAAEQSESGFVSASFADLVTT